MHSPFSTQQPSQRTHLKSSIKRPHVIDEEDDDDPLGLLSGKFASQRSLMKDEADAAATVPLFKEKKVSERISFTNQQQSASFEPEQLTPRMALSSQRSSQRTMPSKSSIRRPVIEDDDDGDPLGLQSGRMSMRASRHQGLSKLEIREMLNYRPAGGDAPKQRPRQTLVEKLSERYLHQIHDQTLATTRKLQAFNSKAQEVANKLEQQQAVVKSASTALSGALKLNLDVGCLSDNLARTCLQTVGKVSTLDRHHQHLRTLRSGLETSSSQAEGSLAQIDPRLLENRNNQSSASGADSPSPSRLTPSTLLPAYAAMAAERVAKRSEQQDIRVTLNGYPDEWIAESQELLLKGPPEEKAPASTLKPKKSSKAAAGKKKKKKTVPLQPMENHPILQVHGPPPPFSPSIRDLFINDSNWSTKTAITAHAILQSNPVLSSPQEAKKDTTRAAAVSARARQFLEVSKTLPTDAIVGNQLNRKLSEIRYTRPFLRLPEPGSNHSVYKTAFNAEI